MRVKVSLAAMAVLVAASSAVIGSAPNAIADEPQDQCKPYETTAVVTEYGGRLGGIPYVSCVPVSTVQSNCTSEPGIPHKRLYVWYWGAPVECKSIYNS